MRGFAALLLLAACLLVAAPPVARADSNDNARLVLHVTAPTTKNQCLTGGTLPVCSGINTRGLLYPAAYFAYILVTNGDAYKGLAGLQFGIDYDGAPHSGVDVLGWTLCATMNFFASDWPGAGSGNMITWETYTKCQRYEPGGNGTGVVANAGYLYVSAYSPDQLRLIPRPVDGYAKVADCDAIEYVIEGGGIHRTPSHLGFATFSADGASPGYNPCGEQPPSSLTCAINGPSTVLQLTEGNPFSVTSNVPGASFYWEVVSGNAVITTSPAGPGVLVNVGQPGSFVLNVRTSYGGLTSFCTKTVTITAGPDCAISGPDEAVRNAGGYIYTVSSSSPGATFAWSLSGNGTIDGITTGSSVEVIAGADTSPFTLSVQVTAGSSSGTCTKEVAVLAAPTCSISGLASVVQSTTHHYTCATNPSSAWSFSWSMTGNGTITGPTDGAGVDVIAGSPGTFSLTCDFTTSAGAGSCQKSVAVQAPSTPTCVISGATAVLEGSPNHQYVANSSLMGAVYSWSIAGNGTITTATTGQVIRVTAGSAGSYVLSLIVAASGSADTCDMFVTVTATPPSGPGLNANAKVMLHVLSPTTKNDCTRSAARPECNAVITHGQLYPALHYTYVLMNDGYTNGGLLSGIGALEFGIDYNGAVAQGVDIYSWHLCGDFEVPIGNWPAPGSGNRVGWDAATNCQRFEPGGVGTGVVTTPGYFYMAAYTPDAMSIVPPANGAVRVTDCQGYDSIIEGAGVTHSPSHLGVAGFGGFYGYNPCAILAPVKHTTWSGIKTLYR